MRLALFLALTAGLLSTSHVSAQAQPQLPARLLRARTVFIDNESGFDRARDEFVDEMGKSQHLRIVYNRADADVIAILIADRARMTSQLTFTDASTGANIWTSSRMWSNQGAVRELARGTWSGASPRNRLQ